VAEASTTTAMQKKTMMYPSRRILIAAFGNGHD
jgi:hypothetical protein